MGLQVLLGALTTGISAASSSKQVSSNYRQLKVWYNDCLTRHRLASPFLVRI
ncbi:hypothetical protein CY34DRAFT_806152 [Suillus luteus UH-Slu-Lm8-n1]|uniref:Uncharacterized protein n=1 Tax=Suillus luteus UH-Slu-Lm8-n1 TaxID=930992 RepID=A0A0D0BD86_9AGAM|nr:hypothetical protein CY34DRAFT_806152 [Suillus luteus UH-Slu-Lm8-n1]